MSDRHNISEVSRVSGIPKDLLRMWERRYGYPRPERDDNGDRIYTDAELDKLVVIRQLVDQGARPGKLMPQSLDQLKSQLVLPEVTFDPDELFEYLQAGDRSALRRWLVDKLTRLGLRAFIHQVVVPATRVVGEAWANGEIAIYEEHLYTELVKNLIRQSLGEQTGDEGRPRVMLTTVPGEKHSVGLLMVEGILRLSGAEVVSFGTEMPFKDIQVAASDHKVDIIGLSFSANLSGEDTLVLVNGLRQMIDPDVLIWVGGEGVNTALDFSEGVQLITNLYKVEQTLAEWRRIKTT